MNCNNRTMVKMVFLFLVLCLLHCFMPTPLQTSVLAQDNDREWVVMDSPDSTDVPEFVFGAGESYAAFPSGRGLFRIGGSHRVETDEVVREMVALFGDSELAGRSERDMVTIFGNATMTGSVGREMVTVFGNANVDGLVERDLVVVFGNLKLGPDAIINRDCVVVFGRVDRDPGAAINRETIEIMPWFSGIGEYLRSGPLMGRLLPPQSIFAWVVVAIHFVVYLLVALILPKPAASGVRRLEDNPFLCFGVGVLAMILLAPVSMILGLTVIGILLIPFLWLSEIALALLGKTSVLQYIGLQLLRRVSSNADNRPLAAFFIGFVLVTCIYMIPVLGLLVWILLRPLAVGAAILAVFGELRKNGDGTTAPGIPVRPVAADVPSPDAAFANPVASSSGAPLEQQSTAPSPAGMPVASGAQPDGEVTVMPRAGFWIRTVASALDFILLVWLLPMTQGFFIFFWLAYHVAMWTWKGTTIGGIIMRLKVVRMDGRPVSFDVALIRGLTAVISAAALFIGFFWAGWSRDRQSWHDIITDTVIVRSPRSVPLI